MCNTNEVQLTIDTAATWRREHITSTKLTICCSTCDFELHKIFCEDDTPGISYCMDHRMIDGVKFKQQLSPGHSKSENPEKMYGQNTIGQTD